MVSRNIPSCWRLVLTEPASGAANMALDQALLENACEDGFKPTLRFYRWCPACVSIGRFQSLSDLDLAVSAMEGIQVVRRPTGGKSILHLDDFTYSAVMPRGFPLPESVVEAYRLICGGILHAMKRLGLEAVLQPRESEDYRSAGGACFAAATQSDLEFSGKKIIGSAQVRRSGALLQHGSVMLEDHSDLLFRMLRFASDEQRGVAREKYRRRCVAIDETGSQHSWEDIAEAFLRGFGEAFDVDIIPVGLSEEEERRWVALTHAYASPRWLVNADSRAFPQ